MPKCLQLEKLTLKNVPCRTVDALLEVVEAVSGLGFSFRESRSPSPSLHVRKRVRERQTDRQCAVHSPQIYIFSIAKMCAYISYIQCMTHPAHHNSMTESWSVCGP